MKKVALSTENNTIGYILHVLDLKKNYEGCKKNLLIKEKTHLIDFIEQKSVHKISAKNIGETKSSHFLMYCY